MSEYMNVPNRTGEARAITLSLAARRPPLDGETGECLLCGAADSEETPLLVYVGIMRPPVYPVAGHRAVCPWRRAREYLIALSAEVHARD